MVSVEEQQRRNLADLANEFGPPVTYAVRSNRGPTPERAAQGCPNTGWVHEAQPPWRVITATDPTDLPLGHGPDPEMWTAEYTGNEATIDVHDWFPPLFENHRLQRDKQPESEGA